MKMDTSLAPVRDKEIFCHLLRYSTPLPGRGLQPGPEGMDGVAAPFRPAVQHKPGGGGRKGSES
jgi:hypothetical protein